jgi:hypothetical protein
MKSIQKIFIGAIVSVLVSSCTKVIDLPLNENTSKLVIQGAISDTPGPYTINLSKSVAIIENYQSDFVNNALVIISDNSGTVDTLSSIGNGNYTTSKIIGTPGNTYSLAVVAEGKTYSAVSTMPAPVVLTALKPLELSFAAQKNTVVVPIYADPIQYGNNYNFRLYKNGELAKSYFLWNDNVNNGGINQRPLGGPTFAVSTGDTVLVEMQCVDKQVYDYYYALQQLEGNGPGGGTTPSDPPTNITGGALGVFSAHALQKQTTIIP